MPFLAAISSLIYPANCFACLRRNIDDSQNGGICRSCDEEIGQQVFEAKRGSLKIYYGSKYSPAMSRIILATKENNQLQARKYLAKLLVRSLPLAMREFSNKRNLVERKIVLIPIPSRKSADRERGIVHIELLLREVRQEVQKEGLNISFEVEKCLSHKKKIADQSSLNFHERESNMRDSFKVDANFVNRMQGLTNSNLAIFLVDDLVTSGSTVQAANRALNHLGIRVDGVLASCATDGFTH